MYYKVGRDLNIRLLDFFNMALSQLPRSFAFSEMKKIYFPHLYNMHARDALHNGVGTFSPLSHGAIL